MADVLVVGGGPAGLSAALTFGRVRRAVTVVDGGSPRNAESHALHNFLTREGVSPAEFLQAARAELDGYGSVELVDDLVASVEGEADAFDAAFESGRRESFRRILLASGIRDELPAIEGLSPLWGTSVFHCPYCHGWEQRDRPLVVLGGDDRAVAQALHLAALSTDAVVCTNGEPAFDRDSLERLGAAGVEVRTEPIRALHAEDGRLRSVELEDGTSLPAEAAFVGPAARPNNALAGSLGCELLEPGTVRVNALGGTTEPGVYAAGDLARNPDVPFGGQMIFAAASGTLAAMAIEEELLTHRTLTSGPASASLWRRRRGR
jgi:thioredoxin reductase